MSIFAPTRINTSYELNALFKTGSMKSHPRATQGTECTLGKALYLLPAASPTVPQGTVHHVSFFGCFPTEGILYHFISVIQKSQFDDDIWNGMELLIL